MPTDLRCPACGNTYPDRWRCECGAPLEFAERPLPDGRRPEIPDAREGLWTFGSFLPVDPLVTLGEGWTPLVEGLGCDCTFKLVYTFQTG